MRITKEIGCEKGNIWLCDEDGNQMAWLRLEKPNTWQEISIFPDNYPGLEVYETEGTDEELAEHIKDHFAGWFVKKCNLDEITLDKIGYVSNPECLSGS